MALNNDVQNLAKAASSAEFLLWQHIERIRRGYTELTNAADDASARTALQELKSSAKDMERAIRDILYKWGCPNALILNVNSRALKLWSWDTMSGLFSNVSHYYARFIHARGDTEATKMAAKIRELTSLFHLVQDLAECSLESKHEVYRRELLGD